MHQAVNFLRDALEFEVVLVKDLVSGLPTNREQVHFVDTKRISQYQSGKTSARPSHVQPDIRRPK